MASFFTTRPFSLSTTPHACSVGELGVALAAGASVIGVNNRNLRTFALDMGTTAAVVARAASLSPPSAGGRAPVILSLSGIKEAADVSTTVADCAAAAAAAGIPRGPSLGSTLRGFLIGEALMRASLPEEMVSEGVLPLQNGSLVPMCTPLLAAGPGPRPCWCQCAHVPLWRKLRAL